MCRKQQQQKRNATQIHGIINFDTHASEKVRQSYITQTVSNQYNVSDIKLILRLLYFVEYNTEFCWTSTQLPNLYRPFYNTILSY
jgi:hypothetical protein